MSNRHFPSFVPPRWLRNPHAQTLLAAYKPRHWDYGWDCWEPIEVSLGRDGRIIGEASWQQGKRSDYPALFLLHGLEGSARSHNIIGLSKKAYEAGFHTIRINMRNCGGTEHLTPTLYCAALSQDVGAILKTLREQSDIPSIYGAGVSLGANVLLKYLGEEGAAARERIQGAAVISPPIDLAAGARAIEEPQNWIYQRYFVKRLIQRMERKAKFFPGVADMKRVARIRTIYEFDDLVTAPHFGFGTAGNYYRLASCGPLLRNVRVPTLIIQAHDDPLIPFAPFRTSGIEQNPLLKLLAPPHGGHSGFLGSRPARASDRDAYWAECRVVQFIRSLREDRHLAGETQPGC